MRKAGDVVYADVDKYGDGIVDFSNRDDMEYAVSKFDDTEFKTRDDSSYIRVKLSNKDRDRSEDDRDRTRSGRDRSRSASRSVSRSRSRDRGNKRDDRSDDEDHPPKNYTDDVVVADVVPEETEDIVKEDTNEND